MVSINNANNENVHTLLTLDKKIPKSIKKSVRFLKLYKLNYIFKKLLAFLTNVGCWCLVKLTHILEYDCKKCEGNKSLFRRFFFRTKKINIEHWSIF